MDAQVLQSNLCDTLPLLVAMAFRTCLHLCMRYLNLSLIVLLQGAWRPSLNLCTVLAGVRQLLAEPNPKDGLVAEVTEQYMHNIALFNLKARQSTLQHAVEREAEGDAAKDGTQEAAAAGVADSATAATEATATAAATAAEASVAVASAFQAAAAAPAPAMATTVVPTPMAPTAASLPTALATPTAGAGSATAAMKVTAANDTTAASAVASTPTTSLAAASTAGAPEASRAPAPAAEVAQAAAASIPSLPVTAAAVLDSAAALAAASPATTAPSATTAVGLQLAAQTQQAGNMHACFNACGGQPAQHGSAVAASLVSRLANDSASGPCLETKPPAQTVQPVAAQAAAAAPLRDLNSNVMRSAVGAPRSKLKLRRAVDTVNDAPENGTAWTSSGLAAGVGSTAAAPINAPEGIDSGEQAVKKAKRY